MVQNIVPDKLLPSHTFDTELVSEMVFDTLKPMPDLSHHYQVMALHYIIASVTVLMLLLYVCYYRYVLLILLCSCCMNSCLIVMRKILVN